eukprot:jgi/Chrzof1/14432/Cz09g02200.t1
MARCSAIFSIGLCLALAFVCCSAQDTNCAATKDAHCISCKTTTARRATQGKVVCTACMPGYKLNTRANGGVGLCECLGGYAPTSVTTAARITTISECVKCPEGSIANGGRASCQACPINAVTNTNQTACLCKPGYYHNFVFGFGRPGMSRMMSPTTAPVASAPAAANSTNGTADTAATATPAPAATSKPAPAFPVFDLATIVNGISNAAKRTPAPAPAPAVNPLLSLLSGNGLPIPSFVAPGASDPLTSFREGGSTPDIFAMDTDEIASFFTDGATTNPFVKMLAGSTGLPDLTRPSNAAATSAAPGAVTTAAPTTLRPNQPARPNTVPMTCDPCPANSYLEAASTFQNCKPCPPFQRSNDDYTGCGEYGGPSLCICLLLLITYVPRCICNDMQPGFCQQI